MGLKPPFSLALVSSESIRKTAPFRAVSLSKPHEKDILGVSLVGLNPHSPQTFGSDSEPLRGSLQPGRRAKRDLLRKGGAAE